MAKKIDYSKFSQAASFEYSEAFLQGVQGRRNGLSKDCNPFNKKIVPKQARDWSEGWSTEDNYISLMKEESEIDANL